jgi:DNA-directed RNA polymerases I, II, and III subunit RPABC2
MINEMPIKKSTKKGGSNLYDENDEKPTFPSLKSDNILDVESDDESSSSSSSDSDTDVAIPKKKIIGGASDDEEVEDAEEDDVDDSDIDDEKAEDEEDDEEDINDEAEVDDDGEKTKVKSKKTIASSSNIKVKSKKSKPITEIPTFLEDDYDEDADDEDYEDDNYLQKFERDMNDEYLIKFHPESKINNYEEVQTLATIVRDENGKIIDPLHKTIPIMTKYEKARILGIRAKQINNGSKSFLPNLPIDIIDGYVIANMELQQKLIPFIIRRPMPNGISEYWKVSDLQLIL